MNQLTITEKAPAKINLTLDVIGRRENGYHNLRMIMQTIELHDIVNITPSDTSDTISFTMNKELPDGCPAENNLVYRAAALMREQYNLPGGMKIYLEKNIPAAAGLAGGSSDCAATLLAINKLYELNLSVDELCKIGVTLGADVPFCIQKGTMLAEGIGEILTPLTPLPALWVLLIKPDISVSTAYVYKSLNLQSTITHPDTELVIRALEHHDAATVAHNLSNVLESVTIPEYPVLSQIKTFLREHQAVGVLMSGSGPTTYGLYQDEIAARMALREAESAYPNYDVILCRAKLP